MSHLSELHRKARIKAEDESHRRILLRATGNHAKAVAAQITSQYRDWETARAAAARLKEYVLDHLPDLLTQFEAKLTARGGRVLWAETAEEARRYVLEVVQQHQVKKVVKSKSMTTEELGLNEFLAEHGVTVWETDLGELIVQLAGEKPYHIVTPAMHKTKADVAKLFREKLNAPETDSAEELTMIARAHLRNAYVTADLGISGANFLVAEEGAISLTENEGNARLCTSCPPVHVAIVGIEKVIPRLSDLAFFLPLLATSGTGQQVSCYNTVIRGPRQPGETDGPREFTVILLDNGRSRLLADPQFRSVLRCLRCGACLNACPVFRTIGGHSYGTVYQGPIGSVLTPHLRGVSEWQHLAHACSLCGACADVCPVHLDLHHLQLATRSRTASRFGFWSLALKGWAFAATSRWRMQLGRRCYRLGYPVIRRVLPRLLRKRAPALPPKTFAQLWREHEQQP